LLNRRRQSRTKQHGHHERGDVDDEKILHLPVSRSLRAGTAHPKKKSAPSRSHQFAFFSSIIGQS
ncbi:hypothetical protein, partial [Rhizobium leguminosarum]|uniref:hypothetical protein n=1 Tax=Rhizobium leguminosarum TaxID=384 RepID=UPI003F9441E7